MTSWVHDYLDTAGRELGAAFRDNRPQSIHWVDPAVTLLEKVEAIARRYPRDPFEPADFVRHYEDAARILGSRTTVVEARLKKLLESMQEAQDIRDWPPADHAAFNPSADEDRWARLEDAWRAIRPMFWGDRIALDACASDIRELLARLT